MWKPDHSAQTAQEPKLRYCNAFQLCSWNRSQRIHDSDSAVPSVTAGMLRAAGWDGVVSSRYRSGPLDACSWNLGDEIRSEKSDRRGVPPDFGEHVLDDAY